MIKLNVLEDGPILVTIGDNKPVALCRCGESENKPFCSGKHRDCDALASETLLFEGDVELAFVNKCCCGNEGC